MVLQKIFIPCNNKKILFFCMRPGDDGSLKTYMYMRDEK